MENKIRIRQKGRQRSSLLVGGRNWPLHFSHITPGWWSKGWTEAQILGRMDALEKWMIIRFTPNHRPPKMDVLPKSKIMSCNWLSCRRELKNDCFNLSLFFPRSSRARVLSVSVDTVSRWLRNDKGEAKSSSHKRRIYLEAKANSRRLFLGDNDGPLRLSSRQIDQGQYFSNLCFGVNTKQ